MKAYVLNREAPAPEFSERAFLLNECYALLKRSQKPKTVADVRAVVEAKLEAPAAVRHALVRLERSGLATVVELEEAAASAKSAAAASPKKARGKSKVEGATH